MAHIIATERTIRAAKAVGTAALRGQKQSCVLQPSGGQYHVARSNRGLLAREIADAETDETAILCMVQVDGCCLKPEVNHPAVAQSPTVVGTNAWSCAPSLQAAEQEIVVTDSQVTYRIVELRYAALQIFAGTGIVWRHVGQADWPAAMGYERACCKVTVFHCDTPSAPEIGRTAEAPL